MNINDIIEKSSIFDELKKDIKLNRLSHSYLFLGDDEFLSMNVAKTFAKMLYCASEFPCLECSNCKRIENNIHPDVLYFPKANGKLGVDEVKTIIDNATYKTVEGKDMIFIIDGIDKMQETAQNKLLKTLEEPPLNVRFFITAKLKENILPTVLSRSKIYKVPIVDNESICSFLESLNVDENTAKLYASISDGNITKSLTYLKNEFPKELLDFSFDFFLKLKTSNDIMSAAQSILKFKNYIEDFLNLLIFILRDVMMEKEGKDELMRMPFKKREIERISNELSFLATLRLIEVINEYFFKLRFNANLSVLCDNLCLSVLEVKYNCR